MKIFRITISFLLILALASCVDRIIFPLNDDRKHFVIDGFITTGPPPYRVAVSESLNPDDPFYVYKPRTLKYMLLEDNLGNVDTLKENDREEGIFYSPSNGMRGTVGRAYRLQFETVDGRVYESTYDTMRSASGSVDSVYREFVPRTDLEGKPYHGFAISFDTSDPETNNLHVWQMTTTYQVETDPKHHRMQCGGGPDCPPNFNCGCLDPLPCSGYTMPEEYGKLVYVAPCECCTCWVTVTNNSPIIQDVRISGSKAHVYADFIALTPYNFMFASHVKIDQYTVSPMSYYYYKAVADQLNARSSLFQPITGKLNGNIVQISGPEEQIEGLFFATSITSRSIYIKRNEIPDEGLIPQVEKIVFANKKILNSCLEFPNSTNIRPSFWPN